MKKSFTGILRKFPLVLSVLCVILIILSFLPPAKDAIITAGEALKGSDLRRPDKWFSLLRSYLFACAVCLAVIQLLIILVQKAWTPLEPEKQTWTALFMSDANLLSVLLAAAVSAGSAFPLKARLGNVTFFAVQIFIFAASYLLSCFCLFHNRHVQGKSSSSIQLVLAGAASLWITLNFSPIHQGSLWHSAARGLFRYRTPFAAYLIILFLATAISTCCVTAFSKSQIKGSRWIRITAAFAYAFLLASLFYIPNIFGDDFYHIHGWEGSVFEVLSLAPYSADHETALYGHYGLFYLLPMKLLHLAGIQYNVAMAAMQFLVGAIMFLSVMYVVDRLVKNDAAFFIFMLATGSVFQFHNWAYFQMMPHRMLFGAVISAALLAADKKGNLTQSWIRVLGLLGVASLLWNPETGLICMGAISVYLFLAKSDLKGNLLSKKNGQAFVLAALSFLAELALAWGIANIYNLLCGGKMIGFKDFMYPLLSDMGLMERLDWPIIGIFGTGFAYFVLFMITGCFALIIKILPLTGENGDDGTERQVSPQLYASIALIGLGFMSYYISKGGRQSLSISYLQFIMITAGLWGIIDAGNARQPVLMKFARILILTVFSSLILENITLPERILSKAQGGWRTDKLNSFLEVLKQDLPEGTPGFGQDVPELYAYMDRDAKIRMTDWANLRFWKDSDSRPFEYASEQLKGYDFFFANVEDVHLVSEAAKFHKIAVYRIGGQGQEFAVYAREGKSLDLSPFKGEGTLASPYIIGNSADLLSLARHVNAGLNYSGVYFRQTADIDISSVKNWTPIADSGPLSFNGNYDGGGHVIKGLRIRKTKLIIERGEDPALFGRLGGRVCNLGIDGGNVQGIDYAAAFASSGGRGAVIANCWNSAEVHAIEASGGIAVNFNGTVACCVNFGRIFKDVAIYGILDGVCAGGTPVVWECRPMEDRSFSFAEMNARLAEAEEKFDLGGMRLIPWGSR